MIDKFDFFVEPLQASDLRTSKDRKELSFPQETSELPQAEENQTIVVNIQNMYGNVYATYGNFNNVSSTAQIPVVSDLKPTQPLQQNFSVFSTLLPIAIELIVRLVEYYVLQ